MKISPSGEGFVFDAGEWKAPVSEHKDQSGARRLILTGPPFVGFAFWPQTNEGRPTLLFEMAQQKYVFERPSGTQRSAVSIFPLLRRAFDEGLVDPR